ncbi:MAG TPA: DUF6285 domain-containing protein [Acetobacteraceae bacterium]|nr:DUF6285 domain-containing protein [Acetobacteraceae bacterium]
MREPPEGAALLETAREVVLKELLPHLPEAQKFAARMVANAMAIAAREGRQVPGWPDAGAREIARVMDYTRAGDAGAILRRFAADIRAGRCDPGRPEHASAFAALRALARRRAEVSAPRALG